MRSGAVNAPTIMKFFFFYRSFGVLEMNCVLLKKRREKGEALFGQRFNIAV